MVKNVALVVLHLVVVVLLLQGQRNRVELTTAKQQTLEAMQETAELMESRIWDQTQLANPPIPKDRKDDFIALLRFALPMKESEEAIARKAFVEFRGRVFPEASDADAYAWAFHVKGMDELARQYELISLRKGL